MKFQDSRVSNIVEGIWWDHDLVAVNVATQVVDGIKEEFKHLQFDNETCNGR